MGAVIIVKGNIELGKILLMLLIDLGDHLFGLDPHLLSLEHDRCTVGIIGTDIMTLMATKFLEAGPDICLYVLEHVAQVNGTVGIWKCAGNKDFTLCSCHLFSVKSRP